MDKGGNMQVYLAGAMQAAPDKGARWREEVTPKLAAMGLEVFNPCINTDGKILKEHGWSDYTWSDLRKEENRPLFVQVMQEIVDADLQAVEDSDIVLVYMDQYVKGGAGTYGELTLARYLDNKYIYLAAAPGFNLADTPSWVWGCIDCWFDNLEDCLAYMEDRHGHRRWN